MCPQSNNDCSSNTCHPQTFLTSSLTHTQVCNFPPSLSEEGWLSPWFSNSKSIPLGLTSLWMVEDLLSWGKQAEHTTSLLLPLTLFIRTATCATQSWNLSHLYLRYIHMAYVFLQYTCRYCKIRYLNSLLNHSPCLWKHVVPVGYTCLFYS
jgi:hypothetical protein